MSTGVVIGRFQVAALHEGHVALLSAVAQRCRRLVVLVGVSPAPACAHDPLPYFCREDAIRTVFPQATVLPLPDQPTDAAWTRSVDRALALFDGYGPVTIFGGRDSAVQHYARHGGRYHVETLPLEASISGTEIRRAEQLGASLEFRQGIVYATKPPLKFPTSYQAVDVALLQVDRRRLVDQLLLGRKPTDAGLWRLPGGFVDPSDPSLEAAAAREIREECGVDLEHGPLRYIGSVRVEDWRFRASTDRLLTALFVGRAFWGAPRAGDDLPEVAWHDLTEVETVIHPIHAPLVARLKETL